MLYKRHGTTKTAIKFVIAVCDIYYSIFVLCNYKKIYKHKQKSFNFARQKIVFGIKQHLLD